MSDMYIINESKQSTSTKKYKCPYCDFRDTRINLVSHIDDEHEDMIPEGYSSARVVFNHINKKDHGVCIQCGMETEWDEHAWKYKRLCGRKKCHDDYVKMVNSRMKNKYGKTHLLNDPEQQKLMLSNRRISGEYKFKDGGIRTYCGSYERKLLEFYDKTLNVHSSEIMTPGPTIEYEFKGKKLFWITDIYYITANLVHDVKDGGDNPNNREMKDYREKQIEKEKSIIDLDKYNYIRLTNNNFQQLLLILAEIKEQLMDNNSILISHVNESLSGSAAANVMPNLKDNVYVTQFSMMGNTFVKDGISFNKELNPIYIIDDDKLKKIYPDDDNGLECSVFKVNKKCNYIKEYIENAYDSNESIEFDSNYFYKLISEKEVLSQDQILFDESFIEELNVYSKKRIELEITENTFKAIKEQSVCDDINLTLPVISPYEIINKTKKLKNKHNLNIIQDIDGYYAININSKYRTESYSTITSIPEEILLVLNNM